MEEVKEEELDDQLSTIAKAIEKHVEGDPNKRIVFDVFRLDRYPSDEATFIAQNAILSALLSLDTAQRVLAGKDAFSYGSSLPDRLERRRRSLTQGNHRHNRGRHRGKSAMSSKGFFYSAIQPGRRPTSLKMRHPLIDGTEDNRLNDEDDEDGDEDDDDEEEEEDGDGGDNEETQLIQRKHNKHDDDENDGTYRPSAAGSSPSASRLSKMSAHSSGSGGGGGSESICDWCHKTFGTTSALYMHIKYKHPHVRLDVYQCRHCSSNFYFRFCIERHVHLKHSHVEPVTRGYRVIPGSEDNEKNSLPTAKKFRQADDPDYRQANGGGGKDDSGTAKGNRTSVSTPGNATSVKCSKCEKYFHSAKYLEEHMSVMHSLRPPKYKCPVCHKSFTWISNMRQHVRTMHGGMKWKWECNPSPLKNSKGKMAFPVGEYSDQGASDEDQALYSMEYEYVGDEGMLKGGGSGEKKQALPCRLCGKVFGTASGRWRHMHNKHNSSKMKGFGDGDVDDFAMFESPKKAKKRFRKKEKDPEGDEKKEKQIICDRFNYQCNVCLEKFPYPISLFNHMKHVHNSTSAGIMGIPKDGMHGKKRKRKRQKGAVYLGASAATSTSPSVFSFTVSGGQVDVQDDDKPVDDDANEKPSDGMVDEEELVDKEEEKTPESGPKDGSSPTVSPSDEETGSYPSTDDDQGVSQLMCEDEEMRSDFENAFLMDESSSDVMTGPGFDGQFGKGDGAGAGEEEEEDEKRPKTPSSGRRPMGTGDKICGTCGKSYHWSAGLWRHQKSTGHTGTV
eukprot:m.122834 g.122834  ORF g.122834 m.122834 type:complete len:785 (+) comp37802_c0_seq1:408-2762(+)